MPELDDHEVTGLHPIPVAQSVEHTEALHRPVGHRHASAELLDRVAAGPEGAPREGQVVTDVLNVDQPPHDQEEQDRGEADKEQPLEDF